MLKVLDRKALRDKGINFSNVHLLRLEATGRFPRRLRLSPNKVGWLESSIDDWINERAAASQGERQQPQTDDAAIRRGSPAA